MKLGVSYNAFDDCIEHLEDSIKSIREAVEYVSVVYQKVSNYGQKGAPETLDLLKSLHESGLIDDCFMFEPHLPAKNKNEVNKRNLGIKTCRDAKCTHFMTIDCDEYYRAEQLNQAKDIILDGDYDSSACQMQTYWKESWKYRLTPPEDYYVSLIFKLSDRLKFVYGLPFGVLVDPSRCSIPGKQRIFEREEIEMHHMSYVRNNIRSKFENSSAKVHFENIDDVVAYYNNWAHPQRGLMFKPKAEYVDLEKLC